MGLTDPEEWRDIPGYVGLYAVSNRGRVMSLSRADSHGRRRAERVLRPRKAKSGHLCVALYANGIRCDFLVHHLVLEVFIGPRPAGKEGCHWDDDPSNNQPGNLRWDTRAANAVDCVRNGGHAMANKTHCPSGHPYSSENTYLHPRGSRVCRECKRIYRENHREERRESGREYARRRRAEARRAA